MRITPLIIGLVAFPPLLVGAAWAVGRASAPASAYDSAAKQAEDAYAQLQKENDFTHVFERVAVAVRPSVVAIGTTREMEEPQGSNPFGGLLPGLGDDDGRDGSRLHRRGHPQAHGMGSGVIVSADGYILTNNHVVEHSKDLKVFLCDNREFPAKVIGTDPRTDLAVIRIDAHDLHPATLGDSDKLQVGQWVAAFGAPFGLDQTISSGIVSAKGRSNMHIADYEDFIQTDAAINPGNSGGPLVTLDGRVVGIDAAIATQSGGSQGVGFAIASNLAHSIMDRLMHEGKVVRGWLGVSIQDFTPELARSLSEEEAPGVLVSDVMVDSPAARAGVKSGDVITQLGGVDVKGLASFRNAVAEMRPGEHAKLSVLRENRVQALDVEMGNWPKDPRELSASSEPSRGGFGLELSDINPSVASKFGLDGDASGVVIVDVKPDSAAESAGLAPGDIVVGIGRKDARSASDVVQYLRSHSKGDALLRVRREGASRWVRLTPAE